MTDGICQFFPARLRPPRKRPQLRDDIHERTHKRSSAPFWKVENDVRNVSFLIFSPSAPYPCASLFVLRSLPTSCDARKKPFMLAIPPGPTCNAGSNFAAGKARP